MPISLLLLLSNKEEAKRGLAQGKTPNSNCARQLSKFAGCQPAFIVAV